jgi:uncharacterized protein YjiS (DUF1127 family)
MREFPNIRFHNVARRAICINRIDAPPLTHRQIKRIAMSDLSYLRYYEPAPRPSLARRLITMLSVRRQRRALADLDDHILSDIGITREQALRESSRLAWDVPARWSR